MCIRNARTLKDAFLALVAERLDVSPRCRFIGFDVSRHGLRAQGRILDMPIAEETVLGVAIGLSRTGVEVFVDLMFESFACRAWDMLVNQTAISSARCHTCAPLTVRMISGLYPGAGPQHGSVLDGLLGRLPHVLVAAPAHPTDVALAYQAGRDQLRPVLLLTSDLARIGEVEAISLNESHLRRFGEGRRVAVVCSGHYAAVVAESVSLAQAWDRTTMYIPLFVTPRPDTDLLAAIVSFPSLIVIEGTPMTSIFAWLPPVAEGHGVSVDTHALWDGNIVHPYNERLAMKLLADKIINKGKR